MSTGQRLFFGSAVLLVFMAGGFAAGIGKREKVETPALIQSKALRWPLC